MRHLLALCLALLWTTVQAAPVAQVAETTGAVTTIKSDGKRRIISPQSSLDEGDVVVTEENSTAVLAFTDGSKVALRPNTRMGITAYNFVPAVPKADKGVFNLLAGGLRTITGAIGKRGNQDAYQMQGVTATIGIRGTEYTARICKGDCRADTVGTKSPAPLARIASLQGKVTATTSNGIKRTLAEGSPLAIGELIETGDNAWAGITFSDDSRVVLREKSGMRIADYRFVAAEPEQDNFAMKLINGAFRAVTGRLGKRNPIKVNFDSVTATIGIRGTRFDFWCVASGSYGKGRTQAAGGTRLCDQALLTAVQEGRIAMANNLGTTEAGEGQAAYADTPRSAPSVLAPPVPLPADDGAPSPESLPLFNALPVQGNSGDGLYVLVHDGRIALTQGGETVELSKGESAFATVDGSGPAKLETTPGFLGRDPFLRKVDFDAVSCTLP